MMKTGLFGITTYTLDILTDILGYVDLGLQWVASQTAVLQLVIWLAAVILIVIGLFVFLKKSIKVFIIIAIIAGVVYVLDMQGVIDIQGLISQVTGAFTAFVF